MSERDGVIVAASIHIGATSPTTHALVKDVLMTMRPTARRVEHQAGMALDVHEDTDYPDWHAVDELARSIVAAVRRAGVEA